MKFVILKIVTITKNFKKSTGLLGLYYIFYSFSKYIIYLINSIHLFKIEFSHLENDLANYFIFES